MTPSMIIPAQDVTPALAGRPPCPGSGTLTVANALGTAVSQPLKGRTFNHAWRPFLSAGSVTFNLGTVASEAGVGPIEPKIKVNGQLVPMSGKNGTKPAALKLDASVANADSVSWVALEVHPDPASGELTKDSAVEIVHTADPISHAPNVGRTALTLIVWRKKLIFRAIPIRMFHLNYVRVLSVGGGAPRHFFL